jgi:cytochrome c peroxidase
MRITSSVASATIWTSVAAVEMLPRSVGRIAVFAAVFGLTGACSAWQTDPDGFTEQDRALIHRMKLLVVPGDPSNLVQGETAAQALGQLLFFDPELGGTLKAEIPGQVSLGPTGASGRLACADCHAPNRFFDDVRTIPNNVSLGIDFTARNSPSLVNVAFYQWYAWDGRSDSLWMQCATAYESPRAMGGTRIRLARRIAAKYPSEYQAIFADGGFSFARLIGDGGVTEFDFTDGGLATGASGLYLDQIAANSYKAMAAYLSKVVSVGARIDAYAGDSFDALSPSEKRGLKVFLGRAGCVECQQGAHVPLTDDGRAGGLKLLTDGPQSVFNRCGAFAEARTCARPAAAGADDVGQFRTKSLRNVSRTPPYMHAGQLQTLEEVVRLYNAGGGTTGFLGRKSPMSVPLGLTETEIADLVAFLEALSGAPLAPSLSCDPTAADAGDLSAHRFRPCPGGDP